MGMGNRVIMSVYIYLYMCRCMYLGVDMYMCMNMIVSSHVHMLHFVIYVMTMHSTVRIPLVSNCALQIRFLLLLLLLLLLHSPALYLGFTILGEMFAYVTIFSQPLR